MANSSINLTSLDFDTTKESLRSYLKSQSAFKDYDFDDSVMSNILDILAYNTFHNAFYMNMVVNESYLDSAQLRNSVVSHAKELNYVPRSARSARAVVDLSFTANSSVVTIPKGTSFTSTVGPQLLTFITAVETVLFSSNNFFRISELAVYEGKETSDQFIVDYENLAQRFVVTDPDVDTRSIAVTIIEDNTGTELTYTLATSTLGLDEESKVFFLQACEDSKYELIFGDGIIGRRPKDNAIVEVEYRITSKEDGNGASKFTLDDGFTDFSGSPVVNTVEIARGGSEPESIESIKFYAPRFFQTQERAINVSDYEIILKQRFPEINAIIAYGGEDIEPPRYGKVFISVDISDVDGIPSSRINEYTKFLKPRIPISIEVEFIEPDELYYKVNSSVKYDATTTTLNTEQVKSLVVNAIIGYDAQNLNRFKASFRYSKFVSMIDSIDEIDVISNETDVSVYKRFSPNIGENVDLDLNFNLPLTKGGSALGRQYSDDDITAVTSTEFTFNGSSVFIEDDGAGTLRLVKNDSNSKVVVIPSVGTVDYELGKVKLVSFRVDSLPLGESYIRFFGRLKAKDFVTSENVILTLEPERMNIEVVPVREQV